MVSSLDSSTIAIVCESSEQQAKAKQLAAQLNLPVIEDNYQQYDFLLLVTSERLALQHNTFPKTAPLYVDFLSGASTYRRQHGGGRNQLLARAVGLKKNAMPTVLDATAGLGRDAFVLACLGCQVHMVERSAIIAALLNDGLQQIKTDSALHLTLELPPLDANAYMQQLSEANRPDVVYLDPMYPPRTKSALVKKELEWLRLLVGKDEDASSLLQHALQCAKNRVVVKRPYTAPCIESSIKPSIVFKGKTSRFDVYLIKNIADFKYQDSN